MEIFLIAIALSMDSAALSVANGAKCLNLGFAKAFKISFVYAFFQAIMPVFGFFRRENDKRSTALQRRM